MLVTASVEQSDAKDSLVYEAFGTIGRASYTLVLTMAGGTEWGIDLAFAIMEADSSRKGALALVLCLLLAGLVLILVLSGLVTGVFLERVLFIAREREEGAQARELARNQLALHELANVFGEQGFIGEEVIHWSDVSRILREYPEVWAAVKVEERDAKHLLEQLEQQDHNTNVDEFIVGLFTLRSKSRSIDMLSIDYEQERALQTITEFRNNLRMSAATLQSKFFNLTVVLQHLESEVASIQVGIVDVQELENRLSRLQAQNRSAPSGAQGGPQAAQPKRGPAHFSAAELMADKELHRRLSELEKELMQLSNENHGDACSDIDDKAAAMSEVAVDVVRNFQNVLEQEMEQVLEQTGYRLAPPPPAHLENALALRGRSSKKKATSGSYLWRALHDRVDP